jgi:hypothetical protein
VSRERTPNHTLCNPGAGLSCFRCCPPIRPPDYDHIDFQGSLRRELADNLAAFKAGRLPSGPMTGFSCPGLGFLDSQGRQAGCLLHPARNQGRDLRTITGYAQKCAQETCPSFRAFAALEEAATRRLLDLCIGMDSFVFSSLRHNPVMRLLEFGPKASRAAAGLELKGIDDMRSWAWLWQCPPAWGWFLVGAVSAGGPRILKSAGLALKLRQAVEALRPGMQPRPPHRVGQPLAGLCPEWEARFWRLLTGRNHALPGELSRWREAARESLSSQEWSLPGA